MSSASGNEPQALSLSMIDVHPDDNEQETEGRPHHVDSDQTTAAAGSDAIVELFLIPDGRHEGNAVTPSQHPARTLHGVNNPLTHSGSHGSAGWSPKHKSVKDFPSTADRSGSHVTNSKFSSTATEVIHVEAPESSSQSGSSTTLLSTILGVPPLRRPSHLMQQWPSTTSLNSSTSTNHYANQDPALMMDSATMMQLSCSDATGMSANASPGMVDSGRSSAFADFAPPE